MKSLMDNAEGVLTSKTVVGEPIRIDDTIIIPLSDVTIGCGAGANNSLNGTKKDSGMGGFSAKMSPTAVLIIRDGYTKVVNVKNQDTLGKLVDYLPELVDKIRNKNTRVTVNNGSAGPLRLSEADISEQSRAPKYLPLLFSLLFFYFVF